MTTARRLKPKIWRAADAGQRRDLGSTVTGRSSIYMYHRLTTYMYAFLRGLILLLRRPTGRQSSSTMRDYSSVASCVFDRCRQSSLYPIDLTYSKETLNTYHLPAVKGNLLVGSTSVWVSLLRLFKLTMLSLAN